MLGLVWVPDPDAWWHLRTGAWILDHGRLPATDSWSAVAAGRHWVPHEWLGEVLLAAAHRLLGHPGVSLLRALLVLALVGGLAATCYRRATPYRAALVLFLTVAATAGAWAGRPQLFSLVLLVPVAARLRAAVARDGVRLWPLVPAGWLWASLHGLWMLGVALAVLAAAGAALDGAWSRARRLALVAAGMLGAAALTPVGPRLLAAPLAVARVAPYVTEWAPPGVRSRFGLPVALLAALVVAGWARSGERVPRSEVLAVVFAAFLGLSTLRSVALGAILLAPYAARRSPRGGEPPVPIRARRLPTPAEALVNAVCAGVLVLGALVAGGAVLASGLASPHGTPEAATRAIPAGARVLNEYGQGGWLLWARPDVRPAIDGRTELYGAGWLGDYLDALALRGDWHDVVARVRPDAAWLAAGTPLVTGLRLDGWRTAYADARWVVLLPPAPAR